MGVQDPVVYLRYKEDFYRDTMAKIVEGLRGDAFVVAQEVGLGELVAADGIDQLVAAMRALVFPLYHARSKGALPPLLQDPRTTCETGRRKHDPVHLAAGALLEALARA